MAVQAPHAGAAPTPQGTCANEVGVLPLAGLDDRTLPADWALTPDVDVGHDDSGSPTESHTRALSYTRAFGRTSARS